MDHGHIYLQRPGGDVIVVQTSLNVTRRLWHLLRGEPAAVVKKLYICDSVGF